MSEQNGSFDTVWKAIFSKTQHKGIQVLNKDMAPSDNSKIYKMEVGKESLDGWKVENPLKMIISLFSKITTKSWAHHQFLVFSYLTEEGKHGEFSVDYNRECIKVTFGNWREDRKDFKLYQMVGVFGAKVRDVVEQCKQYCGAKYNPLTQNCQSVAKRIMKSLKRFSIGKILWRIPFTNQYLAIGSANTGG